MCFASDSYNVVAAMWKKKTKKIRNNAFFYNLFPIKFSAPNLNGNEDLLAWLELFSPSDDMSGLLASCIYLVIYSTFQVGVNLRN